MPCFGGLNLFCSMKLFRENFSLKNISHYKIGGCAKFFLEAKNEGVLRQGLLEAKRLKQKIFILGAATNLLISDSGFDGVVIRPNIKFIKRKKNCVEVGAGVLVKDLLSFVAREGLSGLEWAGGLPGTVGGAVRGNAGCFGGETKDNILSVKSLNISSGKEIIRSRKACRFGYRNSIFKASSKEVVVSVIFELKKANKKIIKAAINEKVEFRASRHPMDYPNIGSIFKNVPLGSVPKKHVFKLRHVVKSDPFEVVPAAYLISEVGLKGVSFGGAMVSQKHSNFIVNSLDASSDHVEALIALAKLEVKKKFGVNLEEEIQRV